jgi:hypothetical protein
VCSRLKAGIFEMSRQTEKVVDGVLGGWSIRTNIAPKPQRDRLHEGYSTDAYGNLMGLLQALGASLDFTEAALGLSCDE